MLLIVGLLLMFYSIITVIGVFNGGDVPMELLHADNTEGEETKINNTNQSVPNLGDIVEPMFPMFNLMSWIIIAFFILVAGGRVARVGIQMLKSSIPDINIIKSDIKEIDYNNKKNENVEPKKKEKKGFFKRIKKE